MKKVGIRYRQLQQATNQRRKDKALLRKLKAHNKMMLRDRMLSKGSLKRMRELHAIRVKDTEAKARVQRAMDGYFFD